jgi:hypothetical protein
MRVTKRELKKRAWALLAKEPSYLRMARTLPAGDWVGADDWVERGDVLTDVLWCATVITDSGALLCSANVEAGAIVECIQTLEKLLISWGETVVCLISGCPESIATSTCSIGMDFQGGIVAGDRFIRNVSVLRNVNNQRICKGHEEKELLTHLLEALLSGSKLLRFGKGFTIFTLVTSFSRCPLVIGKISSPRLAPSGVKGWMCSLLVAGLPLSSPSLCTNSR